jgi:hypothetical protein
MKFSNKQQVKYSTWVIVFASALLLMPVSRAEAQAGAGVTSPSPAAGVGGSSAAPAAGPQGTFTLQNPLSKFDSIGAIVEGFVEIFSYIVILFAVLMLIWTGLQYTTAQGKPERLTALNKQLGMIVIGVAIVIGARIIITVVINTLEATKLVNTNVIQSARNANGN